MALSKFEKDMKIVSKLDDEPNDVGGLSAAELKEKFDEGGEALKTYLNDILIPALETAGVLAIVRSDNLAALRYLRLNADKVLETSPDGMVWEATGSSGHLILGPDGVALPQRSRMQFANCIVEDNGTVTIVRGVTGPKGDKGEQGNIGPAGPQGTKGDTGNAIIPNVDQSTGLMSFSIGTPSAVPAPVYVSGPQGAPGVQGPQGPEGLQGNQGIQGIQGIQGPKGDRGLDGRSFEIEDVYPTLAQLQAAFPSGAVGAYQVTANMELYIWSEANVAWQSIGALEGPQGPQGVQGVQGVQGPKGNQGEPGPRGAEGVQGPKGDKGDKGDPAVVNGKSGSDITLTAADVGARPSTWTPTATDVGAAPASHVDDAVKHITAAERTAWNGKAAGSHTHGAITNDGKIGAVADLPIFTGAGGALTTKTQAEALALLGGAKDTDLAVKRPNIIRTLPIAAGQTIAAKDVVDVVSGAVTKSGIPSQAIALQSGTAGQSIDIIYDGVAELPGITAGTQITSAGVQGYAPQDGWLWVRPEWDILVVSGAYIGDGALSRTIALPFTPSCVILANAQGVMGVSGSLGGGIACKGSPVFDPSSLSSALSVVSGGFKVAQDLSTATKLQTNRSGSIYNYTAFK